MIRTSLTSGQGRRGHEVLLAMSFSWRVVFIDSTGERIRNSLTPKWETCIGFSPPMTEAGEFQWS